MFFALSEQLNLVKGIDMSHSQIRQTVVNYLRDNPTQVRKVLVVTCLALLTVFTKLF